MTQVPETSEDFDRRRYVEAYELLRRTPSAQVPGWGGARAAVRRYVNALSLLDDEDNLHCDDGPAEVVLEGDPPVIVEADWVTHGEIQRTWTSADLASIHESDTQQLRAASTSERPQDDPADADEPGIGESARSQPTVAPVGLELAVDDDQVAPPDAEDDQIIGTDATDEASGAQTYVGSPRWIDLFPWLLEPHPDPHLTKAAVAWWHERVIEHSAEARLSELARLIQRERRSWEVGQLFPRLPAELPLATLPVPARARKALARNGARRAGDLLPLAVFDIEDWPQTGRDTVAFILIGLGKAVLEGYSTATEPLPVLDQPSPTHPPSRVHHEANTQDALEPAASASAPIAPESMHGGLLDLVSSIESLAKWYAVMGLSQMPVIDPPPAWAPDQVVDARSTVAAATASMLVPPQGSLGELLSAAMSTLEDRQLDIFRRRVFADEPETLDTIGTDLGVTRERVRQLEAKAISSTLDSISIDPMLAGARDAVRRLMEPLIDLSSAIDVLPVLRTEVEAVSHPVWRVFDRLDDAYEIEDGWCATPNIAGARNSTNDFLTRRADEYGVVEFDRVDSPESPLSALGSEAAREWLIGCGYQLYGDKVLLRTRSIGDHAAAILSIRDSVLSSEEILADLGTEHSLRYLRNVLNSDDRFVSVGRDRWALAEWDLPEYGSIRSQIFDELDRSVDGSIDVEHLVRRVAAAFNVSPVSVRAYANALPFETVGGRVRVARTDYVPSRPPELTSRLYKSDRGWRLRIRVNREHLRGSGFPAPMSLTVILGLNFGEARILSSPVGEYAVYWRGLQPAFGSIRNLLLHHGIRVDEEVFLVIGDDGRFDVSPVPPPTGDPLRDALRLVGVGEPSDNSDPIEMLANAIGLPGDHHTVGNVLDRLEERGDADITALLSRASDRGSV